MEEAKLFDSLDGLFAYDSGSIDSGIHDEALRDQVKQYLDSLTDKDFRFLLSRYIREYYLTEARLEQGYGIEDVKEFIDWLSDEMSIDIGR